MTIRVALSPNMVFEPKHVNVIKSIHASETSEIFHVTYRGEECCLKVVCYSHLTGGSNCADSHLVPYG
jgi:hypothetical protein